MQFAGEGQESTSFFNLLQLWSVGFGRTARIVAEPDIIHFLALGFRRFDARGRDTASPVTNL
jgi:hypothetical protein